MRENQSLDMSPSCVLRPRERDMMLDRYVRVKRDKCMISMTTMTCLAPTVGNSSQTSKHSSNETK